MGMDVKAKLMYGAEYGEIDLEELEDMVDGGELEYASPYYDADRDDWFVGIAIGNRHATEADLVKAVAQAKAEWDTVTGGLPGTIRCCAHVY